MLFGGEPERVTAQYDCEGGGDERGVFWETETDSTLSFEIRDGYRVSSAWNGYECPDVFVASDGANNGAGLILSDYGRFFSGVRDGSRFLFFRIGSNDIPEQRAIILEAEDFSGPPGISNFVSLARQHGVMWVAVPEEFIDSRYVRLTDSFLHTDGRVSTRDRCWNRGLGSLLDVPEGSHSLPDESVDYVRVVALGVEYARWQVPDDAAGELYLVRVIDDAGNLVVESENVLGNEGARERVSLESFAERLRVATGFEIADRNTTEENTVVVRIYPDGGFDLFERGDVQYVLPTDIVLRRSNNQMATGEVFRIVLRELLAVDVDVCGNSQIVRSPLPSVIMLRRRMSCQGITDREIRSINRSGSTRQIMAVMRIRDQPVMLDVGNMPSWIIERAIEPGQAIFYYVGDLYERTRPARDFLERIQRAQTLDFLPTNIERLFWRINRLNIREMAGFLSDLGIEEIASTEQVGIIEQNGVSGTYYVFENNGRRTVDVVDEGLLDTPEAIVLFVPRRQVRDTHSFASDPIDTLHRMELGTLETEEALRVRSPGRVIALFPDGTILDRFSVVFANKFENGLEDGVRFFRTNGLDLRTYHELLGVNGEDGFFPINEAVRDGLLVEVHGENIPTSETCLTVYENNGNVPQIRVVKAETYRFVHDPGRRVFEVTDAGLAVMNLENIETTLAARTPLSERNIGEPLSLAREVNTRSIFSRAIDSVRTWLLSADEYIARLPSGTRTMAAATSTGILMDEAIGGEEADPLLRGLVGQLHTFLLAGATHIAELGGRISGVSLAGFGGHLANIYALSAVFIPNVLVNEMLIGTVERDAGVDFSQLQEGMIGAELAICAAAAADAWAPAIAGFLGIETGTMTTYTIVGGITVSVPISSTTGIILITSAMAILLGLYEILKWVAEFLEDYPETMELLENSILEEYGVRTSTTP